MPKTVAQCRKHPIPYINTCITYLNTFTRLLAPNLNTCIAHLNTLTRLSAPYLNTCIAYLNTLTRLSAPFLNTLPTRLGCRQPIRIEHPRLSATNQNRVLRNPSRQPIKIEHYVTRELSARPEDPSRLSARVGSL